MAFSAFGAPISYPAQFNPLAGPQAQGMNPQMQGINPYAVQPFSQSLTSTPLTSAFAGSPLGVQPAFGAQLQQALPLLQIVPQQLQHLQQLVSVQLQELHQLQQIVQLLPGQLQQLQQLIQYVPQQLQQLYQQSQVHQSLGQSGGYPGIAATPPWGVAPHAFGASPSHVM